MKTNDVSQCFVSHGYWYVSHHDLQAQGTIQRIREFKTTYFPPNWQKQVAICEVWEGSEFLLNIPLKAKGSFFSFVA